MKISHEQEKDKVFKCDIPCLDKTQSCQNGSFTCKDCKKLAALKKTEKNAKRKLPFIWKVSYIFFSPAF